MTFSFKTDKGIVREINEDSYAHVVTKQGYLCLAIADGMGGHNCGEVASEIAVRESINYLKNCEDISPENVTSELEKAIHISNNLIIDESKKSEERVGMGTTIVLMCFVKDILYFAHCGDSRAYLLRSNELIQLTHDHSYIEELVRIGFLTREEAKNHPSKNVITKALGTIDGAEPEQGFVELLQDDLILICTDGLTNMVSKDEIATILKTGTCPEDISDKLIELAIENGGVDNVTVSVIKI